MERKRATTAAAVPTYHFDPRIMEKARPAAGDVLPLANVVDPEKTRSVEKARRRAAGYVLPLANVPAAGTTSTELPAKKRAKHA